MAKYENPYARFRNMTSKQFSNWKESMMSSTSGKSNRQALIERINDIAETFSYKGFRGVSESRAQKYVNGAGRTTQVSSGIVKSRSSTRKTNSPAEAVNNNTERRTNMATRAQARLERAIERDGGRLRGFHTGRDGNTYADVTTAGGRKMSVPVSTGSSDK